MFEEFVRNNDGDAERGINDFGDSYKIYAVEECAEFIKEVTKAMRNKLRANAMAEEAAHVIISLLRYLEYNNIQYENTPISNWTGINDDIYNIMTLQKYILLDADLPSDVLDMIVASIFKICEQYNVHSENILKEYKTTIHQIRIGIK